MNKRKFMIYFIILITFCYENILKQIFKLLLGQEIV